MLDLLVMRRRAVFILALLLVSLVLSSAVARAEAGAHIAGAGHGMGAAHKDHRHSVKSVSPTTATSGTEIQHGGKKYPHHMRPVERKTDALNDDGDDDDQLAPTWLMDGDAVYAATRSRYPRTYPYETLSNPAGIESAEATATATSSTTAASDDSVPHRVARVSASTTDDATLTDLALLVLVETTNDANGHIEQSVQTRINASIGNIPAMDENVANKVAVALAVVLALLTFFSVVIL